MLLGVTIMMFDPDTNKWTKYCRDCCASCAIGNGSNDNGFHSSVDVCHTAIQKWSSLPPMTTQRDGCAPLVTRFIFLGGHNGQYLFLSSAEVYDITTQKRFHCAATVVGRNHGSFYSSCEIFDTSTKTWSSFMPDTLY